MAATKAGICIRNDKTKRTFTIVANQDKTFNVYEIKDKHTTIRKQTHVKFEDAVSYAITNVIDKPDNE